jgi:hypothetical protein
MYLTTFQALLSPVGQQTLQGAESLALRESDYLRHLTSLSLQFPHNLAEETMEAKDDFPQPASMYFTRPAISQQRLSVESCRIIQAGFTWI